MSDPRQPAQGGASIVSYRLAGRDYPLRTHPTCKVCNSPSRLAVEEGIALGRPYAAIARELPEGADLTARNVAAHYDGGHLPFDVEVMRRIVERRAEAIGRSIDDGVEALVDQVSFAEVVVQRAYEGVARGDLVPDLADGLAAARLLQQVESDVDGGDKAAWTEAVMIYFATAKRVMSAEQWASFGQQLAGNPILRALRQRAEEEGRPALAG